MNDSRQLDVLKRLSDHLAGITPANGYDFDFSDPTTVCRGRRVYGDEDPIPLLSIVEHLDPDIVLNVAGEENFTREENWILLIQGWVDSARQEYPTDEAYQLKAQVEKRLYELIAINPISGNPSFPNSYMLGVKGTVSRLTIGPGIVSGPREGISSKAFFYLPLGVGLVTDLSDLFVSNS